jgi:hypothetical protein
LLASVRITTVSEPTSCNITSSLGYYAALLAVYRKRVVPERMPKAVRLVERLEAALTALCRDGAERREALAVFWGEDGGRTRKI